MDKKKYCEYDINAFIIWLNEEIFCNIVEKAQVVKEITGSLSSDSVILYF